MADHVGSVVGLADEYLLCPSPVLRHVLILIRETEFFFDVVLVLAVVLVGTLILVLILVLIIFLIVILILNLLLIMTRIIFLARRLLILLNFAEVVLIAVEVVVG